METLPPQERRVYLALVALWKPATAREVAELARTETSKCSAQLRRLIGRGVVTVVGGTSRRKRYYVSERLYNIYHLLRRSRGMDGLVGALVEFMDAYYSGPELEGFVEEMVGEVNAAESGGRPIHQAALERMSQLPRLARYFVERHPGWLSDEVRSVTERADAQLERAGASFKRGDSAGALEALDGLLQEFGTNETAAPRDTIARDLVKRENTLVRLRRNEEAIASIEQAIERGASSPPPERRGVLARALFDRFLFLLKLGRLEDAVAACDELISRFEADESPPVVELVAKGLLSRAAMVEKLGRPGEALGNYAALDRRFGSSESRPILSILADALSNQARILARMSRGEESIATCDALIARFGQDTSGHYSQSLVRGMLVKIGVLCASDRVEEQLPACDEALSRLDAHDRLPAGSGVPDYDEDPLCLRLTVHQLRMGACVRQGDLRAATRDLRAILDTLSRLDSIPTGTIRFLLVGTFPLGIDRMASLIRESPSADRLLALTTALEMEMGLQPKVAIEVREVAEDIRRDLARLRERPGTK